MLNYNTKEAKSLRVQLRKEADTLRGQVSAVSYPDRDVRETLTDVYEWSKKNDSLPQTLRRAYDLSDYVMFMLDDHEAGTVVLDDDILAITESIEAFCAQCEVICMQGGVEFKNAFLLHDGTSCPLRKSREKRTSRRSDSRFNRDQSKKENIDAFKEVKIKKDNEAFKEATKFDVTSAFEVKEENLEIVETIIDVLNTRVKADNFRMSPDGCNGGKILIIKKQGGYYPKAYEDMQKKLNTKFEIVGVIFIKNALRYSDRNAFWHEESYLGVVYPVIEGFLADIGKLNKTNQKNLIKGVKQIEEYRKEIRDAQKAQLEDEANNK